jgi:hypothetical protein
MKKLHGQKTKTRHPINFNNAATVYHAAVLLKVDSGLKIKCFKIH